MATVDDPTPKPLVAPARAGNLGMYAGFVTRAAALMLDIVLITIAVLAINALIGLPVAFFTGINLNNCAQNTNARAATGAICTVVNLIWVGVALLASPIYFITLFATTGQTIGKAVLGVRVVRLDGRAMNFRTATVRWLGYFVSAIPLGLGFFWVIVDNRRQGFHDRLADTSVIYAWRATGSARLIERVRARFGTRRLASTAPAPSNSDAARGRYELLALAAPDVDGVRRDFATLRDMVANREISVLATDLLRKTADGQVSSVSATSLPESDFSVLTGLPGYVTPDQVAALARDFPNGGYIVAVLLEDRAADVLVHQLTRSAPILVSRSEVSAQPGAALPG